MDRLVRDYKTMFEDAVAEMQKDILRALEAGLAVKQKTEAELKKKESELDERIVELNKLKTELRNL